MTSISSKIGLVGFATQTDQVTPAAAPEFVMQLAGGMDLRPVRDMARLETTDAGRDMGLAYVSQMRAEGSVPVYVYPDVFHHLAYGALGAETIAAGTADARPANTLPWWTVFRMVGDVIHEAFVGCLIGSLTVEGEAGGAPIATMNVVGMTSQWMTAPWTGPQVETRPMYYHDACHRILVDGVEQRINSLSIGIENNAAPYQADCVDLADIDTGQREITLTYSKRFTAPNEVTEYRDLYYGPSGTVTPPAIGWPLVSTISTDTFSVEFWKDATNSVKFSMPQVVKAEYPVTPDPGGDPIGLDIDCTVEKPTAADILTVTSKSAAYTGPVPPGTRNPENLP